MSYCRHGHTAGSSQLRRGYRLRHYSVSLPTQAFPRELHPSALTLGQGLLRFDFGLDQPHDILRWIISCPRRHASASRHPHHSTIAPSHYRLIKRQQPERLAMTQENENKYSTGGKASSTRKLGGPGGGRRRRGMTPTLQGINSTALPMVVIPWIDLAPICLDLICKQPKIHFVTIRSAQGGYASSIGCMLNPSE